MTFKKYRLTLMATAGFMVVFLGCNAGQQIPPLPTALPTNAPEPTATPAPIATSAPSVTSAPEGGAGISGITFTPDASFGAVTAQTIAAEPPDPNGPPWILPEHYRFDLLTYPVSSTYHPAQIFIFPIANFEGYPDMGPHQIEMLKTIIAGHPDLSSMGGMQNPLPLIPPFNAAQIITVQPQYLNFQNGTGIRFLTQYDQAPIPINNNELFYTFQGITADGKFYVAVIMPVAHPDLLSGTNMTQADYEAMSAQGEAYFTNMTAKLNGFDAASFNPNLALLDAMVQSLKVAP